MKVKNIAFSGIMAAILMGASGANAAVEIASKQYVLNQVGDKATTEDLNTAKSALQGAIDLKASQADLNTANAAIAKNAEDIAKKADNTAFETLQSAVNNETTGLATKASKTELTEGLAAKVDLSVYNQHLNDQTARDEAQDTAIDALVGTDGQGGSFAELTTKVETLTGGAEVTGSVANQIASALTDANDYTDEQITALTTGEGAVAKNAAAIAALETSKADAGTVSTLSGKVDTLTGTVEGWANDETGIAATYATKTELKTTDDKAVANAASIKTINEGAVMTSGIDADKVAQIETNKNAITTLNADAQTTGSVDNKVSALLGGVPVSNTCDALSGLCVLTKGTDGSLVWIDVTNPADAPL